MLGVGIGGVRAQFEACRWDCRISSPFRGLESGLEEFEHSSRLGVWIGGAQAEFRHLESGLKEFEPSSRLGDWIGGVRAQFEVCSRDCRSSSPVRGLEPGLEEFEPTSGLGDWIGGV